MDFHAAVLRWVPAALSRAGNRRLQTDLGHPLAAGGRAVPGDASRRIDPGSFTNVSCAVLVLVSAWWRSGAPTVRRALPSLIAPAAWTCRPQTFRKNPSIASAKIRFCPRRLRRNILMGDTSLDRLAVRRIENERPDVPTKVGPTLSSQGVAMVGGVRAK